MKSHELIGLAVIVVAFALWVLSQILWRPRRETVVVLPDRERLELWQIVRTFRAHGWKVMAAGPSTAVFRTKRSPSRPGAPLATIAVRQVVRARSVAKGEAAVSWSATIQIGRQQVGSMHMVESEKGLRDVMWVALAALRQAGKKAG